MNREKVQKEALDALIKNEGGTVVLSTGTGKSKVAIDYIKYLKPSKVLITSPRTNLKENWRKEIEKWLAEGVFWSKSIESDGNNYTNIIVKGIHITIVNIQTCYKWSEEQIAEYNLIIMDEVHTMATEEYGNLAKNATKMGITKVGLTATPDDRKKDKIAFYIFHCPIVYKYLDSAKDGIVNKRKYIIYEYELNNMFEVEVKVGKKRWYSGEKKQYDYLQSQVEKGEEMIREILEADPGEYVNYFGYAQAWYWKATDTTPEDKKKAGGIYMRAISARKDLLWSLTSTATLAKSMRHEISEFNPEAKILIFSERTEQADVISRNTVHSNNSNEVNEERISKFNSGEIKTLASCNSLTLGLNLNKPKYAIMESYNSSDVIFKQRAGRTDRLPVDENAIVTFIVVKNTQCETWFNKAVNFKDEDEVITVDNILDYKEALKKMY